MPRKRNYIKVPTTIYLTKAQHTVLHTLSKTHCITIAQMCRQALDEFITREYTRLKAMKNNPRPEETGYYKGATHGKTSSR